MRKMPAASKAFRPGDESGFLLVVTMIILVVLTIVGMAALDDSTFEIRIAGNDRLSKVAFNLADGSVYSVSKLITEAIEGGADPGYASVNFLNFTTKEDDTTTINNNADDFYRRVMGFTPVQANPDFQIKPRGAAAVESIEGRLIERNASMIAGGGVEFGAGAAGAGIGSGGGGAAVTFDVEMSGYAGFNTRSTIAARYRKVLGAGGGL